MLWRGMRSGMSWRGTGSRGSSDEYSSSRSSDLCSRRSSRHRSTNCRRRAE